MDVFDAVYGALQRVGEVRDAGYGAVSGDRGAGLVSDQEYGWWRYTAPRQSFVYRADFNSVTHTPASLATPGLNPSCVTDCSIVRTFRS